MKKQGSGEIIISPPQVVVSSFSVEGSSPLVSNRFSAEVAAQMREDMANNTTKAAKKERRNGRHFAAEARASLYQSAEGWHGMPANAFKSALVRAGQLCGVEMTILKQCLYVVPDGVDALEGHVQLVRIDGMPAGISGPDENEGCREHREPGAFRGRVACETSD